MLRDAGYSSTPLLEWRTQSRVLCIAALTAVIAFSHGIFELTFDKRAGIPFLREVVIVALVPLSAYCCFKNTGILRLKLSVTILAYVAGFLALSAFFAWWWFGQPPKYALLEERRVIGMLWFFPALAFTLKYRPSENEINRAFLFAGAALSVCSLLYYVGIIPENTVSDIFVEQYFYADDDPRNLTRYVLGSNLLAIAIPFYVLLALRNLRRGNNNFWVLCVLGGCVFTLLMIDQSRSLLISIACTLFFALLGRLSPQWRPVLACAAVLSLFGLAGLLFGASDEKTQWLLNSLLNGQGVRNQTSQIIWQVLRDSWFWGHGALSIQYNRGFLAIYNDNFWLNDVGKLGLLYRFGFLTLLFAAFYVYALRFLLGARRLLGDRPHSGNWPHSSDWPLLHALVWTYLVTLVTPWGSVNTLLPAELGIVLGLLINTASNDAELAKYQS